MATDFRTIDIPVSQLHKSMIITNVYWKGLHIVRGLKLNRPAKYFRVIFDTDSHITEIYATVPVLNYDVPLP